MSSQAVIFSPDDMRGALISRMLERKGLKVSLFKNIRNASEAIASLKPHILIVDTEGYFPSELGYFASLSPLLADSAVLFVANSSINDTINMPHTKVDWCVSYPLDLQIIATKALELLKPKEAQGDFKHLLPDIEKGLTEEDKVVIEDEDLEKDLMGFIGLK
jgi:DNA-binding NtrC family response regulator